MTLFSNPPKGTSHFQISTILESQENLSEKNILGEVSEASTPSESSPLTPALFERQQALSHKLSNWRLDRKPGGWALEELGLDQSALPSALSFQVRSQLREKFDLLFKSHQALSTSNPEAAKSQFEMMRDLIPWIQKNLDEEGEDRARDLLRVHHFLKLASEYKMEGIEPPQIQCLATDLEQEQMNLGARLQQMVHSLSEGQNADLSLVKSFQLLIEIDEALEEPSLLFHDLKLYQQALDRLSNAQISSKESFELYLQLFSRFQRLRFESKNLDKIPFVHSDFLTQSMREISHHLIERGVSLWDSGSASGQIQSILRRFLDRLIDHDDLSLIRFLKPKALEEFVSQSLALIPEWEMIERKISQGENAFLSQKEGRDRLVVLLQRFAQVQDGEHVSRVLRLLRQTTGLGVSNSEALQQWLQCQKILEGAGFFDEKKLVDQWIFQIAEQITPALFRKLDLDEETVKCLFALEEYYQADPSPRAQEKAADIAEKLEIMGHRLAYAIEGDWDQKGIEYVWARAWGEKPARIQNAHERLKAGTLLLKIHEFQIEKQRRVFCENPALREEWGQILSEDLRRLDDFSILENLSDQEKLLSLQEKIKSLSGIQNLVEGSTAPLASQISSQKIIALQEKLKQQVFDLLKKQIERLRPELVSSSTVSVQINKSQLQIALEADLNEFVSALVRQPNSQILNPFLNPNHRLPDFLSEWEKTQSLAESARFQRGSIPTETQISEAVQAAIRFSSLEGICLRSAVKRALEPLEQLASDHRLALSERVNLLFQIHDLFRRAGLQEPAREKLKEILKLTDPSHLASCLGSEMKKLTQMRKLAHAMELYEGSPSEQDLARQALKHIVESEKVDAEIKEIATFHLFEIESLQQDQRISVILSGLKGFLPEDLDRHYTGESWLSKGKMGELREALRPSLPHNRSVIQRALNAVEKGTEKILVSADGVVLQKALNISDAAGRMLRLKKHTSLEVEKRELKDQIPLLVREVELLLRQGVSFEKALSLVQTKLQTDSPALWKSLERFSKIQDTDGSHFVREFSKPRLNSQKLISTARRLAETLTHQKYFSSASQVAQQAYNGSLRWMKKFEERQEILQQSHALVQKVQDATVIFAHDPDAAVENFLSSVATGLASSGISFLAKTVWTIAVARGFQGTMGLSRVVMRAARIEETERALRLFKRLERIEHLGSQVLTNRGIVWALKASADGYLTTRMDAWLRDHEMTSEQFSRRDAISFLRAGISHALGKSAAHYGQFSRYAAGVAGHLGGDWAAELTRLEKTGSSRNFFEHFLDCVIREAHGRLPNFVSHAVAGRFITHHEQRLDYLLHHQLRWVPFLQSKGFPCETTGILPKFSPALSHLIDHLNQRVEVSKEGVGQVARSFSHVTPEVLHKGAQILGFDPHASDSEPAHTALFLYLASKSPQDLSSISRNQASPHSVSQAAATSIYRRPISTALASSENHEPAHWQALHELRSGLDRLLTGLFGKSSSVELRVLLFHQALIQKLSHDEMHQLATHAPALQEVLRDLAGHLSSDQGFHLLRQAMGFTKDFGKIHSALQQMNLVLPEIRQGLPEGAREHLSAVLNETLRLALTEGKDFKNVALALIEGAREVQKIKNKESHEISKVLAELADQKALDARQVQRKEQENGNENSAEQDPEEHAQESASSKPKKSMIESAPEDHPFAGEDVSAKKPMFKMGEWKTPDPVKVGDFSWMGPRRDPHAKGDQLVLHADGSVSSSKKQKENGLSAKSVVRNPPAHPPGVPVFTSGLIVEIGQGRYRITPNKLEWILFHLQNSKSLGIVASKVRLQKAVIVRIIEDSKDGSEFFRFRNLLKPKAESKVTNDPDQTSENQHQFSVTKSIGHATPPECISYHLTNFGLLQQLHILFFGNKPLTAAIFGKDPQALNIQLKSLKKVLPVYGEPPWFPVSTKPENHLDQLLSSIWGSSAEPISNDPALLHGTVQLPHGAVPVMRVIEFYAWIRNGRSCSPPLSVERMGGVSAVVQKIKVELQTAKRKRNSSERTNSVPEAALGALAAAGLQSHPTLAVIGLSASALLLLTRLNPIREFLSRAIERVQTSSFALRLNSPVVQTMMDWGVMVLAAMTGGAVGMAVNPGQPSKRLSSGLRKLGVEFNRWASFRDLRKLLAGKSQYQDLLKEVIRIQKGEASLEEVVAKVFTQEPFVRLEENIREEMASSLRFCLARCMFYACRETYSFSNTPKEWTIGLRQPSDALIEALSSSDELSSGNAIEEIEALFKSGAYQAYREALGALREIETPLAFIRHLEFLVSEENPNLRFFPPEARSYISRVKVAYEESRSDAEFHSKLSGEIDFLNIKRKALGLNQRSRTNLITYSAILAAVESYLKPFSSARFFYPEPSPLFDDHFNYDFDLPLSAHLARVIKHLQTKRSEFPDESGESAIARRHYEFVIDYLSAENYRSVYLPDEPVYFGGKSTISKWVVVLNRLKALSPMLMLEDERDTAIRMEEARQDFAEGPKVTNVDDDSPYSTARFFSKLSKVQALAAKTEVGFGNYPQFATCFARFQFVLERAIEAQNTSEPSLAYAETQAELPIPSDEARRQGSSATLSLKIGPDGRGELDDGTSPAGIQEIVTVNLSPPPLPSGFGKDGEDDPLAPISPRSRLRALIPLLFEPNLKSALTSSLKSEPAWRFPDLEIMTTKQGVLLGGAALALGGALLFGWGLRGILRERREDLAARKEREKRAAHQSLKVAGATHVNHPGARPSGNSGPYRVIGGKERAISQPQVQLVVNDSILSLQTLAAMRIIPSFPEFSRSRMRSLSAEAVATKFSFFIHFAIRGLDDVNKISDDIEDPEAVIWAQRIKEVKRYDLYVARDILEFIKNNMSDGNFAQSRDAIIKTLEDNYHTSCIQDFLNRINQAIDKIHQHDELLLTRDHGEDRPTQELVIVNKEVTQ